jgi:hypothetical protein
VNLCAAGLVDATGVNSEMLESVTRSSLSTEAKLAVASFAFARTTLYFLEAHLFKIRSPSMREDCVAWNAAAYIFEEAEVVVILEPKKVHKYCVAALAQANTDKMFSELCRWEAGGLQTCLLARLTGECLG